MQTRRGNWLSRFWPGTLSCERLGRSLSIQDRADYVAREAIYQSSDPEPEGVMVAEPERQKDQDVRLRPRRMTEIVGQSDVIERLQIAIDAARKRGEPLGHILFDGPPGLGKTTFATVIPEEMGTTVQIASGAALSAPKDLLPYLTNAQEGSVLFIDEIHRLPKAVEEFMYPAMEDFRIDITLGEGVSARTVNMTLRPFTIIGATTRSGLLSAPLRDRFQVREHLGWYTLGELCEIVQRNAVKLQVDVASDPSNRNRAAQSQYAATGEQSAVVGTRLCPVAR
jgi:Holliday junction DNA helicase RuvB